MLYLCLLQQNVLISIYCNVFFIFYYYKNVNIIIIILVLFDYILYIMYVCNRIYIDHLNKKSYESPIL